MARINATLAVNYVNDFGNAVDFQVPFKIHRDAPLPPTYYGQRTAAAVCGANSLPYKMRKLKAYFPNVGTSGGQFEYPVSTRFGATGIVSLASELINLGAICVDLVGERWGILTNNVFAGNPPTYRQTPYDNIPGEPAKVSVRYTYFSDLQEALGQSVRLGTSFEEFPDVLAVASGQCLLELAETSGASPCSGSSLGLSPRRFLWKATATDTQGGTSVDGIISRQSIISTTESTQMVDCARLIAPAVECIGYRGENAKNLQNLI